MLLLLWLWLIDMIMLLLIRIVMLLLMLLMLMYMMNMRLLVLHMLLLVMMAIVQSLLLRWYRQMALWEGSSGDTTSTTQCNWYMIALQCYKCTNTSAIAYDSTSTTRYNNSTYASTHTTCLRARLGNNNVAIWQIISTSTRNKKIKLQ